MNLNFLAAFVDLCDTLSFSKTARRLNTVQPVISRQIKELEVHLGYPLFVRSKREVRLTGEGIDFKNKIVPLYSSLVSGLKESDAHSADQKIGIKIGCTIEAGENLLYPALKPQLSDRSAFQFQVTLEGTSDVLKKLSEGEIDLGIVTRDPGLKGTTCVEFAREKPILIGPNPSSISVANLETIPLVTYRDSDRFSFDFLERNFSKSIRKKIHIVFSVNSHRLMIDYVKNNLAFAVIPNSSAKEALQSKQIKVFAEDKREFSLKLIFKNSLKTDKRKNQFIEWLLKSL